MKNFFTEKKDYFLYSFIFLLIILIIFIPVMRNNQSLIYGDGDAFHQHFLIFTHYINSLKESFTNIFTFDWSIGLGNDAISQFGYYIIGDIFSYIGLLFPSDKLNYAYSLLIILRMYFIGFFFLFYCKNSKKTYKYELIGSLIYVFSSFVFNAGVVHPYFLNAAIIFPLYILATERLLQNKNTYFFSLITCIAFINNFYFAYKLIILCFIYALIYYFVEVTEKSVKDFLLKLKTAFISFCVGVMMSCIILLPVIYTFLNVQRVGAVDTIMTYDMSYYLNLLNGLITPSNIHWSVIGTSSVCLIAIPVCFMHFKNNKRICIYFIILCTILMVPFLGSIMNGFSYPTHRWSFAFTFIVSLMTIELFEMKLNLSKKDYIVILFFLISYIVLALLQKNMNVFVMTIFALIFLFFIILKNMQVLRHNLINLILYICICINIINLGYQTYYQTQFYNLSSTDNQGISKDFLSYDNSLKRYQTVDNQIEKLDTAVKYIINNDQSFYRIAVMNNNIANLSLLYNYNSTSEYLSLTNGNVANMSYSFYNSDYSISKSLKQIDNRTRFSTLLSVKYYIVDKKNITMVPYGYQQYAHFEDTYIYQNKNFLPVLSAYDSWINSNEFDELNAVDKEIMIMNSAYVDENKIVSVKKNVSHFKSEYVGFTVDKSSELKIINNKIVVKDPSKKLVLKLDSTFNKEVYLSWKNLNFETNNKQLDYAIKLKSGSAVVKKKIEDRYKSQYYVNTPQKIFNLGHEIQDNKIIIEFSKSGVYSFSDLSFYSTYMDNYEAEVKKLNKGVRNVKVEKNYVSANLSRTSPSIIQLNTGYSVGWKAYVDNEEVPIFKCNLGMVGIEVPEGEHDIYFEYSIPFIKVGIIMSLMGIIIWTYMVYLNRKSKR